MPPRRAAPASPARSTRSSRSARGREDDDWEGESVMSNISLKVPNSRNGRSNGNGLIGFKDTSVNVAAAFHAAKVGAGALPTPSSDRAFSVRSKTPVASSSHREGTPRAQSPAEQLASSARALSPVKYFLQSTNNDFDGSGDYSSFSSMGGGDHSGETSYDYMQEEEYVRQAQKLKSKPISKGPRISDTRKKSRKAMDDEMPYRPGEDDESIDDSDGDGADGHGEALGYDATPAVTHTSLRSRGKRNDGEGDYDQRGLTPVADISGHRRSPTPAQLLRALSPRTDRRSPAPSFHSRKRRPSSLRTIITNLLHGLVITLRFVVELVTAALRKGIVEPGQAIFGSGRDIGRKLKKNWWKWLGGILALGIVLRLLEANNRGSTVYHAPTAPPGSMDELVARLTSVEHQLHELSTKSQVLAEADTEAKQSSAGMLGRMDELESAVMLERKRIEELHGDSKSVRALQHSYETLKAEVDTLATKVASQDKGIATAQKAVQSIEAIDHQVRALNSRVTEVEQGVKDALDDGRLRAGLERILPRSVPVRINSRGTIDIEPVFWTEMKKMLMGQTETEVLVRKLLKEAGSTTSQQPAASKGKSLFEEYEKQLEEWSDKVFERKSHSGAIISHESFVKLLERNLVELREELERKIAKKTITQTQTVVGKASSPSSITIESGKGDDLTTLFNDLIDTALLRYSKDTIARADYALFTAGARVIPSLTSDTLVLQPASKLWKKLSGTKDVEGRPPATALHPDISVGSCWPFKGDNGSIGVSLTAKVRVTDITIEHAPGELALSTATAPKVVKVLGLLDENDTEGRYRLEEYWAEIDGNAKANYLPIGTFTYDPGSTSHIQTFPVAPDVVELGIKVGVVVFQVESNHGGEFTCLYRVRVHGETD